MPEGESLTVLLVEDDPTDAALFKSLLGHTPSFGQLHADSLERALSLLDEKEADAIVLDLGLPDSALDETYRRVRDAAPAIPVIVLTGHDDDESAYQALADGAQDYLVKDEVTETLLAKAIRYSVERQRAMLRRRSRRVQEMEVFESLAPERLGVRDSSVAEGAPEAFDQAVRIYDGLLDLAVTGGYAGTEAELTVQIDGLAARLADLRAAPPDLAAIHVLALGGRQPVLDAARFEVYEDLARLLLLRLTGELANQYRRRGQVGDESGDGALPAAAAETAPPLERPAGDAALEHLAADDDLAGTPSGERSQDGSRRPTEADYAAWADRMRPRARKETAATDAAADTPTEPSGEWDPEALFRGEA